MIQQVYEKMETTFKEHIPDSLYMNYQELSSQLGSTPQAWEHLLDQPDFKRFIDLQLSKYMEIDARKALHRLAQEDTRSTEVTALTKIIENSKLLQQKHQAREHIVFSFIPPINQKHDKQEGDIDGISNAGTPHRHDMS